MTTIDLTQPGALAMLSTVVPVYNEAESLELLHGELDAVAREHGYDVEFIFVDDGSTDHSWRGIRQLAEKDSRVRGLRFRRNFGKAAALSAGFNAARGELVVTLDADLQDDPAEIPRFLEAMANNLDVASGWKKVRYDPWHKVFPSHVFNWMVSKLTGVRLHDHNCGMKCFRRAVVRDVRLYGELHRFVPVLAAARGFRVGELIVHHRPRKFGHSKYGVKRFVKGFLDLLTVKFLTRFGQRPQHLFGTIGLFFLLLGGAGLAILAGCWLAGVWWAAAVPSPETTWLAAIFSTGILVLGVQSLSIGLLAELVVACQWRDGDTYSIAERTTEPAENHTPVAS